MTAHDPDSAFISLDGFCAVIDRAYNMVAFGGVLE
jgi:hypothetical protein